MGTTLTGDTWGIPGPTFLVVYLVLAVTAVGYAVTQRRRIASGGRRGAGRALDGRPEDVAYLNGGPNLAVYAALSAMHVDGSIVTSGRTTGQVRAGGTPGPRATALQRAIHTAARRLTPGRTLRTHGPVRDELRRIAHRLESEGMLLSAADRARFRGLAWLPGAVVVLGLVRVAAGYTGGRPVGFLTLLVIAVSVVTVELAIRVPHRTRHGDAALEAVRTRHVTLAPDMRPDWTAVGAGAAALSVGAFGVGAMLAAEPAFADELAAQKFTALGGGSGSGGGGGSDGGASSGGGSSCGGGGGGGGCGG